VVTEYLQAAGLLESLNGLHFDLVGYGCTTCIGNSGPCPWRSLRIAEGKLVAAVLSGIVTLRVAYTACARQLSGLAPLVVAYRWRNRGYRPFDGTLAKTPRKRRLLAHIWPTSGVGEALNSSVRPRCSAKATRRLGCNAPGTHSVAGGALYQWHDTSTYIQEPPFFIGLTPEPGTIGEITVRAFWRCWRFRHTDHISQPGIFPRWARRPLSVGAM